MTALASTRALLERSIDYAGTFPPAALSLRDAAASYAHDRDSSEAWLLGRLVVRVGDLDAVEDALPPCPPDTTDYELSAIMTAGAAPQLARINAFNQRRVRRARVASVEFPPMAPSDMSRLAHGAGALVEAFFETPIDADLDSRLDAIWAAGAAAKVRTGGTVADAIPTPASLARFLHGCAQRNLAFKATAGLHHAIRSCYSLTYERDSATAVMHGFLNVSVAAALARHGAPVGDIAGALGEPSAAVFHFGPDGLTYRDTALRLRHLADTRLFFRSFGSCSFREPAEELARLRLL